MSHYAVKYYNGVEWVVAKEFEGTSDDANREFQIARFKTHPNIAIVIEKYLHDPQAVEIDAEDDISSEATVKRTRRKE